jgi:hypothetical protein
LQLMSNLPFGVLSDDGAAAGAYVCDTTIAKDMPHAR